MITFIAAVSKEVLLLGRDRAGLLVLFLMPAILVVIITLVQENVMELTGQSKTRMVFLDLDDGDLGPTLYRQLATGNLEGIVWDKKKHNAAELKAAVTAGKYQVGIVLTPGASARFHARLTEEFRNVPGEPGSSQAVPSVRVFFDPGIMAGLRSGITARLQMAAQAVSVEAKMKNLERILKTTMAEFNIPKGFSPLPEAGLTDLLTSPLLTIKNAGTIDNEKEYNPVQQNVPAWALFGLFFTAIPIAGSILQERKSGIRIRLNSLPVSPLLLMGGKIGAYIGVCLCQFLLIGLIGICLFPWIGLPSFTIGAHPLGVGLIVLFASLAACGYGIFLGMACNTYEQASTLGATSIVAAAAIGGIMVPVYAMPGIMQHLSILSPLNWGLTAFHDLLMRDAPLSEIFDDLARLSIFFMITMIFSWKLAKSRL